MSNLTWQPGVLAGTRDLKALEDRVSSAFDEYFPDAEKSKGKEIVRSCKRLRADGALLHPEVFHKYFNVPPPSTVEAVNRDFGQLGSCISESLARAKKTESWLGLRVDLQPALPGVDAALQNGARHVEKLVGQPVTLRRCSLLTRTFKGRLRKAVDRIAEFWPEVHDEFSRFVRVMVIYRGHAVIGFTDFSYHGSIFFKYEHLAKHRTAVSLAEELIHEAAHVRLNATMACTPLFENSFRPLYRSPLRPDRRSMYGVFHQMYVLTRVVEWYRRLLARQVPGAERAYRENLTKLKQAFATVRKHAILTLAGAELVDEIGVFIENLEDAGRAAT